ncbi:MAG TPA: hypothetical protein VE783_13045 [Candidatus Limnocylindrales bacterium]|nr:hypothetical protein [Candidatus Limnocylindrales bacterium]
MKPLRQSFALVLRTPRLWLVQVAGNVAILLLYAGWLRLAEAHWWELVLNLLVPLMIFAGAVVLHGGTLNFYCDAQSDPAALITPAFRNALRHLVAIVIWIVVFFILWDQLNWLDNYSYKITGFLRSSLPAWLRKHTAEEGLNDSFGYLIAVLRWVVLPGLLLPMALLTAELGLSGLKRFREWGRMLRSVSYWVVLALAAIIGVVLTDVLMEWKPRQETATLFQEEVSVVIRMIVAYGLALFSWLWVCSMLGRLRPAGEPAAEPAQNS